MTHYIVRPAPLSMIDGKPASKVGEWPGIKPNKFSSSKKIIHIKNSSIFSFDDSLPFKTQKKLIFPTYKKESPKKSNKKRVYSAIITNNLKNKAFHNDYFPTPLQNYNRLVINREYDFEKREKYYKKMQQNFNIKLKENEIMSKTRNNKIGLNLHNNSSAKGFNKQFYERVSNNKILKITLTQELYHKYKNKIEKMKKFNNEIANIIKKRKVKSYKFLTSRKKILEMMDKEKKLKSDIEYVSNLDEMELNQVK